MYYINTYYSAKYESVILGFENYFYVKYLFNLKEMIIFVQVNS